MLMIMWREGLKARRRESAKARRQEGAKAGKREDAKARRHEGGKARRCEGVNARRGFFSFLSHLRAFTRLCVRAFAPLRFRAFTPLFVRAFAPLRFRAFPPSRLQPFITIFFLCVILFSCTKSAYYEKYQTIEGHWDKNKELFFIYEIDDSLASYNLLLEIRNNNLYPYQNLWLFCSEEQPEGTLRRDTIECMLADDFGKWKGTGISIYHISVPIRTKYTFPNTGKYTFNIRQGMRDDRLRGIEQIGVRIEKNL